MKASLKNARISPKKANLVAGLIRGKKAVDALSQLKFTPKKAAEILYKILQSAVSNATTNFAQDEDKLYIKSIIVNKGITYKRGIPVSRGRYHRILKRNSNITVEVGLQEAATDEKPAPPASTKVEMSKAEGETKTAPKKEKAEKEAKKDVKKDTEKAKKTNNKKEKTTKKTKA